MSEYGAPFDLRQLPGPMFDAHLAILEGQAQKRNEERKDAESEAESAQRELNRGRR